MNDSDNNNTNNFINSLVDNTTSYWIIVLTEINWEDLRRNLERKVLFITTFGKHPVKKKDIVLIYQKHTINAQLHGFVGFCQIAENFGLNNKGVVIFKDQNMAKHISSLLIAEYFKEPYKTTIIDHILKTECSEYGCYSTASAFNAKYTKEKTTFIQLPTVLGYSLLKNLVALSDNQVDLTSKNTNKLSRNETSDDDNDDAPYSSSESEFDEEEVYSTDSDESEDDFFNNNDVRVIIGHIPILMEPCNEFDWNKDEFMTVKSFKKHFLNCKKCIKTDNNECNVCPFVQDSVIKCIDVTDEKAIEECLDYYYNGKICKFELVGDDRKKHHMYIYRILSKHHHYHNAILVMW